MSGPTAQEREQSWLKIYQTGLIACYHTNSSGRLAYSFHRRELCSIVGFIQFGETRFEIGERNWEAKKQKTEEISR